MFFEEGCLPSPAPMITTLSVQELFGHSSIDILVITVDDDSYTRGLCSDEAVSESSR